MSSDYAFPHLHLPPIQRAVRADYSTDDSAEDSGREMQIWFGYFEAGDILIDMQARRRNWPANLIYPAIFCYRHGLEVAMKAIIRQYGRYAGCGAPALTHNLQTIWTQCRPVLEKLAGSGEFLTAMDRIVAAFHQHDPAGDAFRYAYKTDGAHITTQVGQVDALRLKAVMSDLACYLDLLDTGVETQCYEIERLGEAEWRDGWQ